MRIVFYLILIIVCFALMSCERQNNIEIVNYSHNASLEKNRWDVVSKDTISFQKVKKGIFIYGPDTMDIIENRFWFGSEMKCDLIKTEGQEVILPEIGLSRYVCNKPGYSDVEAIYFISRSGGIILIWSPYRASFYDQKRNQKYLDIIFGNKEWLEADYIPSPPPPPKNMN